LNSNHLEYVVLDYRFADFHNSSQYPRCLEHRHKSYLHSVFSVFSAHYVSTWCGPDGFQKSRRGYLTIMHTGTPFTISSCVAPPHTLDGGCLDLTTISFGTYLVFRGVASANQSTDFICLSNTGWHRLDGHLVKVFQGWASLCLRIFLSFFYT